MKSPIAWYGGKHYLAPRLCQLLPQHTTYVEVFGGGGSLLFAKPPSAIEVYNDIDEGLVNFWRVVRDPDKYPRLQTLLELTPYSRAEYYECAETWQSCDDDVERARRWFATARMGFSGQSIGRNAGWKYTVAAASTLATSSYLSAIEHLPAIHRRLRMVQLDCRDWRVVLTAYDRPDTLFYLDPPYILDTRVGGKRYSHELTDNDHHQLTNVLLNIKGMAILSGYASEIYQPLETAEWQRIDYNVSASAMKGANERRVESVWLSPSAQTTQLPLNYLERIA